MQGFPGGSAVEDVPANAGDVCLIPGSGRSPGEGNGNPLQYSSLGSPMEREAWKDTVHRVTKVLDMTERLNNTNDMQATYWHAENNFCVRSHKLA